jgi:hypothetical protein
MRTKGSDGDLPKKHYQPNLFVFLHERISPKQYDKIRTKGSDENLPNKHFQPNSIVFYTKEFPLNSTIKCEPKAQGKI